MNKTELAKKINSLEGLAAEERIALLDLLRAKSYGLVWEDKPEAVEEEMRQRLPVLKEVPSRAILSTDPEAPNHILIEGDNLHALTALSYTHAGKIDVIYIDPPYNTGNKDFKYNDEWIAPDNIYRHSTWLSFIKHRLEHIKNLLKPEGVLFISIGDQEVAQLKLLCDEMFDVIALVPRVAKKGSDQGTHFRPTKDYVIVCSQNKSNIKSFKDVSLGEEVGEARTYKFTDENGRKYRKGHSLYQASLDPLRGCKNQRYYIEAPDGTLIIPPGPHIPSLKEDASNLSPITKQDKVWRWSFPSYLEKKHLIMFDKSKRSPLIDSEGNPTQWNVYEKKYADEEVNSESSPLPNDIIDGFVNSLGTSLLNSMGIDFPYSKPVELVHYLIEITDKANDITILDFFAGSGTTLHATMQLNAEDGGHRQCILCTNNENNICEEVTYERNKRVIKGYQKPNGEDVPGLKANSLRYYKTDFVGRENNAKNRRELVMASTDLLCIKNDIYAERPLNGNRLNPKYARYFEDNRGRMLVVYQPQAIKGIVELIAQMPKGEEKMKVYVFSHGTDTYADDFASVGDRVELCALPKAILDAYSKVLPRRQPKYLPEELVQEIIEAEQHPQTEALGGLFGEVEDEKGGEQ